MASVGTAHDRFGLARMLQGFRGAALLVDDEHRLLEATPAAAEMLARSAEELRGQLLPDVYPDLAAEGWLECDEAEPRTLARPGTLGPQLRVERQVWRDDDGAVVRRLFLMQPAMDLTELQARLGQQSRLSTLGTLVSGIAHEINNPLTGVLGFLELILLETEDKQVADDLRRAYDAAQRCRRIVSGLLTFARGGRDERVAFDFNGVVAKTLDIVGGSLRRAGIEVRQDLSQGMPAFTGDFFRIQQILLNLITNAQHAIQSRWSSSGGALEIRTESDVRELRLLIRDNGTGIASDDLAKIFDPFFTTKGVGEGTGLGLAVSYGIARDHGGDLRLESKWGEGTTAILSLPLPVTEKPESDEDPETGVTSESHDGSRPMRLLLVDDEEVIRQLMEQILRRDGHDVETAADGEEAWRRLQNGECFDGILSDLRMPKMGGAELHDLLAEVDPELAARMIFITGDVADDESAEFYERVKERTLLKPCTMESVLNLVGRVLGRPSATGEPRSAATRSSSISSSRERNKSL